MFVLIIVIQEFILKLIFIEFYSKVTKKDNKNNNNDNFISNGFSQLNNQKNHLFMEVDIKKEKKIYQILMVIIRFILKKIIFEDIINK